MHTEAFAHVRHWLDNCKACTVMQQGGCALVCCLVRATSGSTCRTCHVYAEGGMILLMATHTAIPTTPWWEEEAIQPASSTADPHCLPAPAAQVQLLAWQRQPGTAGLTRQFMFQAPFSTPLASGTATCTQDHLLSVHQLAGGASQLSLYIEQRTPELPTGEVLVRWLACPLVRGLACRKPLPACPRPSLRACTHELRALGSGSWW
jgi:hypothetical protein